jgi:hypothetical protein
MYYNELQFKNILLFLNLVTLSKKIEGLWYRSYDLNI